MSRRLNLEDAHAVAEKNNGKCLSKNYINIMAPMIWQCSDGHTWSTPLNNIRNGGTWCPYCYGNIKLSIDVAKRVALQRNGKCLSRKYLRSSGQLLWECSEGHRWKAKLNNVKDVGTWCPECARKRTIQGSKKHSIQSLRNHAIKEGGDCLSPNYLGIRERHKWQCSNWHEWFAVAYSVLGGVWCPECTTSNGERRTRIIFEQLFKKEFPRKRPKWLMSKKGWRMELDGYCSKLHLAFEYQGLQHFKKVFPSQEAVGIIQDRDARKRAICRLKGVQLIEVPYSVQTDNLRDYIVKELSLMGVEI